MKYLKRYRVKPDKKVHLKDYDPNETDPDVTREEAVAELPVLRDKLRELQWKLYNERRQSLLICLQAPDAGGKDGTIKHVLGAFNPIGCQVVSFKKPGRQAQERDYLWRVHLAIPARGGITIYNRSQYEDVLITRVRKLVPEEVLERRYFQINVFEKYLSTNNTHILKFYLHISKAEQLKRFKKRLEDPARQWKISDADYAERKLWVDYQEAFEQALSRCSTDYAPWFIIPANKKWFRNLAIGRIVTEYLEQVKFCTPACTVDLDQVRRDYEEAAGEHAD